MGQPRHLLLQDILVCFYLLQTRLYLQHALTSFSCSACLCLHFLLGALPYATTHNSYYQNNVSK